MNQTPPPVLENDKIAKKVESGRKGKLLKWVLIVVIGVIVILGGLIGYQKVILPSITKPSPTPVPTEPLWKTKSAENVNLFLDLWIKSQGTTNSDQYAKQAKDLLTISAQNKLLTYKTASGASITKMSDQLNSFVGIVYTGNYEITDQRLVDEKTVQVTVNLTDKVNEKKVFTAISESGVWLIDTVADWHDLNKK